MRVLRWRYRNLRALPIKEHVLTSNFTSAGTLIYLRNPEEVQQISPRRGGPGFRHPAPRYFCKLKFSVLELCRPPDLGNLAYGRTYVGYAEGRKWSQAGGRIDDMRRLTDCRASGAQ